MAVTTMVTDDGARPMDNKRDSTEFQEEGRSQKPAYGLGYFGHLDPEPPLVLVYLTVFSILAGVGFVAWLGWDWRALVLTALVAALVVGALVFRRASRRGSRGRRGDDPSSAHYDDARAKSVEDQTRMHLDSKGPLGF